MRLEARFAWSWGSWGQKLLFPQREGLCQNLSFLQVLGPQVPQALGTCVSQYPSKSRHLSWGYWTSEPQMCILPCKATPMFTPQNNEQMEVVGASAGVHPMVHVGALLLLLHRCREKARFVHVLKSCPRVLSTWRGWLVLLESCV